ncbi:class I SAM-dependent methyltransferase [Solihabitans fulvus]|uniref:Class I SAM-dependent methyltransferase n=1 Tax=Solihabitans fulvus TaxID=1892852 RepID=A0A5B2XHD3_9PSEU|nr:class I SAM-dependent methyltransferase [Solihabitans fulvus]KAA2262584.1 class I SAM-dependent methyltransferase [Solihabitans fulvus]
MDRINQLLDAAETRSSDLAATISAIGFDSVAELLFQEIRFRARIDEVAGAGYADTTLVLVHEGHKAEFTVPAAPDGGPGGDLPSVVITQEVGEIVRSLYGPRDLVSAATRTVRWPGAEVAQRELARNPLPDRWAGPPQRILDVLDRRDQLDLGRLAAYYGTDKWGPLHQYTRRYEQHLSPWRDRRVTILEIGVGGYDDPQDGGESLRMWKHYFPRAIVCGVDIVDKRALAEPRMPIFQADQSDRDSLLAVIDEIGRPDVIIDDGSHISAHVIASFEALFPYLRHDGLYFVEDLQTALWPFIFGGNEDDLTSQDHTFGFLKQLVDGLHYEEFMGDSRAAAPTDREVTALHVYHNLAVIEKGTNAEGSPGADAFRTLMNSQSRDDTA